MYPASSSFAYSWCSVFYFVLKLLASPWECSHNMCIYWIIRTPHCILALRKGSESPVYDQGLHMSHGVDSSKLRRRLSNDRLK